MTCKQNVILVCSLLDACVHFLRVSLWRSCFFFLSFCRVCSFTLASILRCHCSHLICYFIVIYAKLDERKGGLDGSNIRKKQYGSTKSSLRRFWRRVLEVPLPPQFNVPCKLNCKVHSSSGGIDFSSLCFCFRSENPACSICMYTRVHIQ